MNQDSSLTAKIDSLPAARKLEVQIAITSLEYLRAVSAGLGRSIDTLTADDLINWASR